MKILKLLIFLILATSVFGQSRWTFGEDIISKNGNGYWVSNEDSVFFDEDTLYIAGAETLEVYVNVGRTLGMIRYYGTVHTKDTLGYSSVGDTVYFNASLHRGDGNSKNALITETFYAMDSCKIVHDSTGVFDVYFFANSNLEQVETAYYTLRIYGVADKIGGIWIKEERVFAY